MTEELKIKVRNLHKAFGDHVVLEGVNLDVKKGTSLVILGGSGTGKSVLIKSIIGLIQPDLGTIEIDDVDINEISTGQKSKIMQHCGYLFQGGALFDSLNVRDNITFFAEKTLKLSAKNKEELAAEKLEAVGLSGNILKLYPAELSGGMQKRVALARAICDNPDVIFFDEPTTGLDPIMANVINELIIKVTDKLGATAITITHDMASAYAIAHEVALLYKGKIIWKGSKEEMKNSDNAYLNQFINGSTQGPIELVV